MARRLILHGCPLILIFFNLLTNAWPMLHHKPPRITHSIPLSNAELEELLGFQVNDLPNFLESEEFPAGKAVEELPAIINHPSASPASLEHPPASFHQDGSSTHIPMTPSESHIEAIHAFYHHHPNTYNPISTIQDSNHSHSWAQHPGYINPAFYGSDDLPAGLETTAAEEELPINNFIPAVPSPHSGASDQTPSSYNYQDWYAHTSTHIPITPSASKAINAFYHHEPNTYNSIDTIEDLNHSQSLAQHPGYINPAFYGSDDLPAGLAAATEEKLPINNFIPALTSPTSGNAHHTPSIFYQDWDTHIPVTPPGIQMEAVNGFYHDHPNTYGSIDTIEDLNHNQPESVAPINVWQFGSASRVQP
ncbi:hypothetical protein PTTG_08069 [Puccinia triticina 1-1 BBBD Race 1]|uniref:Uncharacterized protein n=1 Tax=Puccinia triticina (isolate 1-1 / race 1 (BBBD)) TaxID=630390 RepID=A0A0C4F4M9_PUCT1|nr:hypothetical protein PTTG_08069 [Puccinia triticina 1-1 BBBD Race 1]WAR60194.1 hypothetical protein PtB15_9B131 [Puccinia triticina]